MIYKKSPAKTGLCYLYLIRSTERTKASSFLINRLASMLHTIAAKITQKPK